ncbi:MAG: DUF3300 domain-containing protein [Verrucomicrobiia bacterium]|jgi:hypothetical protein
MKPTTLFTSALMVLVSAAIQAPAQWAVPPPAPAVELRSGAELDQLLAPIALYPDPLIAQILPAATQPGEIVLAARYVFGGGDMNEMDLQPWSLSVKAVARYPEVLKMMDQRLDWTAQLGQAFLYQQADVMDTIQRLRVQAQMLGNLRTTPQQYVVADSGVVEILPASPEMIYVPVYQPDYVFARPGFFLSFGTGFSIGFWLNHDCDWHHRNIFTWHRDSYRPHDWWRRSPRERHVPVAVNNRINVANRSVSIWRPHSRTPITTMNRTDRGWETRDGRSSSVVRAQPTVRPSESRETRHVTSEPRRETGRVTQRSAPATTVQPVVRPSEPRETRRVTSELRRETERVVQRPAPVVKAQPVVRPSELRETRRVISEPRRETAPTIQRIAPTVQHTSPAPSVRSYSGAYAGRESARDARAASSRGQQSREAISRPAPPSRPAPSQAAPAPSSRGRDDSDRRKR